MLGTITINAVCIFLFVLTCYVALDIDMDMSNAWEVCKIWRVRYYASTLS
jgi:hypothetical protein